MADYEKDKQEQQQARADLVPMIWKKVIDPIVQFTGMATADINNDLDKQDALNIVRLMALGGYVVTRQMIDSGGSDLYMTAEGVWMDFNNDGYAMSDLKGGRQ